MLDTCFQKKIADLNQNNLMITLPKLPDEIEMKFPSDKVCNLIAEELVINV